MTEPDILQPDFGPEAYHLYPREIQEQINALAQFRSSEEEETERKAEREKRIAAQKDWALESEEGRRRARA